MKRTLLLLPVLALFLMACPQRHATTAISPPPPAPDPNGYNHAPPVNNGQVNVTTTENEASEVVVGSNSNTTSSGTSTVTVTETNTRPDTAVAATVTPGTVARPDSIRLKVSFISKGEGIDHVAKENLDKWLAKNADVKYYITQRGREGEVQYCFDLRDRKSISQAAVVKDVRAVIGSNDRVFVTENVVCTHTHDAHYEAPLVAEETIVPESRPVADTTRLVVSFISKGEGIDYAAKTNLDKWLSKHADVKYSVMQKGREGEMKYCFVMKDRKATDQVKLISEIKTAIGTSDRVLYAEKTVCDHVHELTTGSPQVVEGNTLVGSRPDTTNNTARLVVSFTSKGEGIDYKTKEEFENWLKMRGNVTWETKNYGREGETNFCFFLTNMDARQQEIFVRDVRTQLTGKETVFVEEYAPCDKRK